MDELKSGPYLVLQSPGLLLLLLLVVANSRPSCGLWFPPVPSRTLQTQVVGPVGPAVPPRARLRPDPRPPDTHPEGAGRPGAPAARRRAATLLQQRRSSRLRTRPSSVPSTSSPSTSESHTAAPPPPEPLHPHQHFILKE